MPSNKMKLEKLNISREDLANNPKWKPDKDFEYNRNLIFDVQGSKYTAEDRYKVATLYAANGNLTKTAQELNLPYETIKDWKYTPWFQEVVKEFRKNKQEELEAKLTEIIHLGINALVDRVTKGEEVVDLKTGNIYLKGLGGDALARIVGIMYDKRALLRGDPTSRTEKISAEDTLRLIMERMEEAAKKINEKNITPIDGELTNE